MPVIRTYDISNIEEVKRISSLVKETQEYNKYEDYDENNIMLVRITNNFPTGRKVSPLSNNSVILKSGDNFIFSGLYNKLDYRELKEFETYQICYRSTVHFALNGLVSSHMYGNFSNQLFIILEPISSQLGKANFRNFAGQDTFVKGDVSLSENAIIIINAEQYDFICEKYPEIENFNVIIYKGIPAQDKEKYISENKDTIAQFDVDDERAIVELVLMDLGYTPEIIGSHYIISSPTSDKIREVNKSLAEKYNVVAESKHNYTEEYSDDKNKNAKITAIFDELLLDFILKINNINMPVELNSYTAVQLLEFLGKEKLINSIAEFNRTIEEMHQQNLLPTSEGLLNGHIPNVYEFYINNLLGQNEKKNVQ